MSVAMVAGLNPHFCVEFACSLMSCVDTLQVIWLFPIVNMNVCLSLGSALTPVTLKRDHGKWMDG